MFTWEIYPYPKKFFCYVFFPSMSIPASSVLGFTGDPSVRCLRYDCVVLTASVILKTYPVQNSYFSECHSWNFDVRVIFINSIGGSKVALGNQGRTIARSNFFFIFMQFWGKCGQNNSLAPQPWGKILNLPLNRSSISQDNLCTYIRAEGPGTLWPSFLYRAQSVASEVTQLKFWVRCSWPPYAYQHVPPDALPIKIILVLCLTWNRRTKYKSRLQSLKYTVSNN